MATRGLLCHFVKCFMLLLFLGCTERVPDGYVKVRMEDEWVLLALFYPGQDYCESFEGMSSYWKGGNDTLSTRRLYVVRSYFSEGGDVVDVERLRIRFKDEFELRFPPRCF